jgi:hypothetical protein
LLIFWEIFVNVLTIMRNHIYKTFLLNKIIRVSNFCKSFLLNKLIGIWNSVNYVPFIIDFKETNGQNQSQTNPIRNPSQEKVTKTQKQTTQKRLPPKTRISKSPPLITQNIVRDPKRLNWAGEFHIRKPEYPDREVLWLL